MDLEARMRHFFLGGTHGQRCHEDVGDMESARL